MRFLLANHALIIGKPSLFYQLTISQLRTNKSMSINGLIVKQPQIVVFVWSPWSHVHLGVSVDIGINSFSSLTL